MTNHSKLSQNDRRLKRINSDARKIANKRGKKELEESEKNETQMKF